MLVRRLTLTLLAFAALLGFSALPSPAAAQSGPPDATLSAVDVDDPIDDETFGDEDLAADDGTFDAGACDFLGEDDVAADEDDADLADDETFSDDDDLLDPIDEEAGDDVDAVSDEDLDDITDEDIDAIDELCAALDEGIALDEAGEPDTSDLASTGSMDVDFYLSGPGTVDGTLTGGSSTRAVIAKAKGAKVLGRGHTRAAKAGKVTLKVKLTKKGRKLVKKAKKALSLTLGTKVKLDSGKTIKGTKTVTVKPAKKKPGKKGKKPAKH